MLQRPAIAVNSNSSLFVRARGIDGVEIWRMQTERSVVIATIPMSQSVIGITWFSESQVAIFGKNGQVKVYNVLDSEDKIKVEYVENSKLDLGITLKSFVALGRKIVFGDDNGSVWLAEFNKSWLLAKSHGHKSSVDALVFSPDGSRIASAGRDKKIKIWSAEIPNDTTLETTHSQVLDFFSIAYDSSDDSELLKAEVSEEFPRLSSNDVLDFFSVVEDVEDSEEILEDQVVEPSPLNVPFPSSETNSPELVNLNSIAVLEGGSGWAIALEFSSDSKRLVSGAMDNCVYLWDIEKETLISSQEKHEGWVSSVSFSPGDKLIASGSWDKNICLFDGQTLEWLETMKFHRDYVVDVEFQNSALYSASYDGLIAKWNTETYKIEEILDSDSDWIQAIRFLNNGTLISVCSDGSSVQWSLPTNEIVWKAGQTLSAGIKVGQSSDFYAYIDESEADIGTKKAMFNIESEAIHVEAANETDAEKITGDGALQVLESAFSNHKTKEQSMAEAVSDASILSGQRLVPDPFGSSFEGRSKTEAISDSSVLGWETVSESLENKLEEPSEEELADAILLADESSERKLEEPSEEELADAIFLADESSESKLEEPSDEELADAILLTDESSESKLEEPSDEELADAIDLGNDSSIAEGSVGKGAQFRGGFVSQHFKIDPESSVFDSSESIVNTTLPKLAVGSNEVEFHKKEGAFFGIPETRRKETLNEEPILIQKVELSPLHASDIPSEVLDEMIDEIGGLYSIDDELKSPVDQPSTLKKPESNVDVVPKTNVAFSSDELLHESSEYRAISHDNAARVSKDSSLSKEEDKTVLHELPPEKKTALSTLPPTEKKAVLALPSEEEIALHEWPSTEKITRHDRPSRNKITPHNLRSRDKITANDFPPQSKESSQLSTSTMDFSDDLAIESASHDSSVQTDAVERELTKPVHALPKTPVEPDDKLNQRVPNEPIIPQGFESGDSKIEEVSPAEIFIQRKRSSASGMGVVRKIEPVPTRFEQYVTIRTPHENVYGIALSHNGSRIASCGDSHLCIWSSSGQLLHKLDSPTAGLNAIMFTYDDRIVVAAGDDGNIHIWFLPDDTQQIIQHAVLQANQVWVTNMDISADMRTLISAGYDGTARIWDLSTGECIRTLSGHTGPVTGVTMGARTYTCGADGTIRVWNDVWKLVDEHHGFDKLTGIATHGTNICVTAANGDVFFIRSGKLIPLLRHRGEARTAKMRSDGVAASAGEDGLVMFYQPEFETPYAVIKLATPIWDVAFNHEFCVVAGDDGRIYLHRAT